jgi:hypothetical protein
VIIACVYCNRIGGERKKGMQHCANQGLFFFIGNRFKCLNTLKLIVWYIAWLKKYKAHIFSLRVNYTSDSTMQSVVSTFTENTKIKNHDRLDECLKLKGITRRQYQS